jgi:acyl-CoA synthetase (NDP forming)
VYVSATIEDDSASTHHDERLFRLFSPRSVAIVGVSGNAASLTARPIRLLREHGFAGRIYPINPKYEALYDLPCFPDLRSTPGPVDCVLSFASPGRSIDIIEQAAEVGAAAVIVLTSGFAETGDRGRDLQEKLRDRARELGVRLLGPNCLGLINRRNGLFATFSPAAEREQPPFSCAAYVGRSGALGGSLLDMSNDMGLGFVKWAATGNQADLDLVELASTMIEDPAVRVLLMYAEGMGDGHRFVSFARRAQRLGTSVVMLRSGHSDAGRRAATSHTGAIVGDDAGLLAAAHRYGVIVVDDLAELLWTGASLATGNRPKGRRMAIVTTSGGAGILMADQMHAQGLEVADLADSTKERIRQVIPAFGSAENPVDVTAQILSSPTSTEDMSTVLTELARDASVDGIVLALTMVTGTQAADLARLLVRIRSELDVPIWVMWLTGTDLTRDARSICRQAAVPVFTGPRSLARVINLSTMSNLADHSPPTTIDPVLRGHLLSDRNATEAGWQALKHIGVTTPAARMCLTGEEAELAAEDLGGSVVMKLYSDDVAHKTEIGGVALGVTAREAAETHRRLIERAGAVGIAVEGVLVQAMIPRGIELIIGAMSSGDGFPPTITVGMGGVTAELYSDVAVGTAPITTAEAEHMLRRLRGWPLLDGYRGSSRCDIPAAANAVATVSVMICSVADTAIEFEVNPLIVGPEGTGAVAVDVLVNRPSPPALASGRDQKETSDA